MVIVPLEMMMTVNTDLTSVVADVVLFLLRSLLLCVCLLTRTFVDFAQNLWASFAFRLGTSSACYGTDSSVCLVCFIPL